LETQGSRWQILKNSRFGLPTIEKIDDLACQQLKIQNLCWQMLQNSTLLLAKVDNSKFSLSRLKMGPVKY